MSTQRCARPWTASWCTVTVAQFRLGCLLLSGFAGFSIFSLHLVLLLRVSAYGPGIFSSFLSPFCDLVRFPNYISFFVPRIHRDRSFVGIFEPGMDFLCSIGICLCHFSLSVSSSVDLFTMNIIVALIQRFSAIIFVLSCRTFLAICVNWATWTIVAVSSIFFKAFLHVLMFDYMLACAMYV